MGYFDFVKHSDYMVCIDSDGCAMDTLEVKHRECFGPQWIYTYGLDDRYDECMKLWLDINLYSITRGINRFKGLVKILKEGLTEGDEVCVVTIKAETKTQTSGTPSMGMMGGMPTGGMMGGGMPSGMQRMGR